MANPLFAENAAAFRHARLQLGWSQEYFAEKAILSVATINAAEAGNRVYPKTHRAMLDAINKGRAASRPPLGMLVLDYPAPTLTTALAGGGESIPVVDPIRQPEASAAHNPEPAQVEPAGIDPKLPNPPELANSDTIHGKAPPFLYWNDQRPLFWPGGEPWRIKDACEGVAILGATGSGKTSGSGKYIARSYLQAGFGGLVLCAKPDESALWKSYAAKTGRESDLILFGTDPRWSFNFLEHESRRQGAGANLTENLVNLFTEIGSLGAASAAGSGSDPFWERAMRSLVRNCVDLLNMANVPMTLHNMFEVVRSAPTTPETIQSEEWREASACWRYLKNARTSISGPGPTMDFHEVSGYWLELFPTLGDRTRSSIVAMFMTLAEALTRSKMRELFCSGTTIAPEDILAGHVIVIDLPVKEWGEVGRIAAVLWKYCFQKTVERRKDNADGHCRPVFLWADECQNFVSRHDAFFQATARSSRGTSVYMTQSIPTLVAAMGGEREGRASVDSLLNSLGTKFFHANGDATTNRYASELIGKEIMRFGNASSSVSFGRDLSSSRSRGYSEQLSEIVRAERFGRLIKGGPENQYEVEAIIVQTGRTWGPNRAPFCFTFFDQRGDGRGSPPPRPPMPPTRPRLLNYLFPWTGRKQERVDRWAGAAVVWFFLGLFGIFAFGAIEGAIHPAPPATVPPVPAEIRFVEDRIGTKAKAFISARPRYSVLGTVKVTSHSSGETREIPMSLWYLSTPMMIGDGVNGTIEDGDKVEVYCPGCSPVAATYHHSTNGR